MSEPVFLIDEDLIALGRALKALYPDTIYICGTAGAPRRSEQDPKLYAWCREHGAVLVTADFNMLRDQAILRALLQQQGLRVVWLRQVRGQTVAREAERIIGRWSHIRKTLADNPGAMGLVLAGTGQLRIYRTISDAVYEVLPRRRQRRSGG
jgi:predicted nuclease of predicted toxin-antitoxin system